MKSSALLYAVVSEPGLQSTDACDGYPPQPRPLKRWVGCLSRHAAREINSVSRRQMQERWAW